MFIRISTEKCLLEYFQSEKFSLLNGVMPKYKFWENKISKKILIYPYLEED